MSRGNSMKNQIKEVRLMKGLNQRELSEKTHTPQSIISSLERGVLKPWPKVMKKLSRVLKTPAEVLFPENR